MSQNIQLEIKGLHTYSSELSGVPAGALSEALNVNISRLNIVESRRGYNFLNYALPLTTDRAKKLIFYSDLVFCHYGTTFALYNSDAAAFTFVDADTAVATDTITETAHGLVTGEVGQFTTSTTLPAGLSLATDYYIIKITDDAFKVATTRPAALLGTPVVDITSAASGGTHTFTPSEWVSRGTLSKPTNSTSVRSATLNKNLYITSSTGILKMDDITQSIYQSGLPKGLHMEGALSGSTGTAIPDTKFVAFRYVVGTKDANNNLILGGVSSRLEMENGSGAVKDIDLTVYIPSGLSTGHFVQIYRSDDATTSATIGDELQLSYEYNLTSTDISNGYFTVSDITPSELLGAYLYTSPTQGGIVSDNAEPPLSSDIAEYKGHLFFADTVSKYRYTTTIIACGGSSGIIVDDTMTIADGTTTEVYTAKASYTGASKQYVVDTASASLSTRIDTTARSLVKLINEESAMVYAYLLNGGSGLPGTIILEAKALGAAAFTLVSDRATAYSPQLDATADTAQTASNDAFKNGLMYSKHQQPESVPLANIFFIGSSDDRIKRILPLRDGLLIFKEEEGVWILSGNSANSFTVRLLDSTANVTGSDSLVVVNNLVYGLFDSGIGEVSDNGVSIISLPIKDQLLPLYASPLEQTRAYSFGISNQIDGKYILSLPTNSDSTYANQQFIYDVFGKTWCKWDLQVTCGGVNPADGKMYFGPGDSSMIKIERKNYDYTDNADYGQLCTISAATTTLLNINNIDDMGIGDYLIQDDVSAYVDSIDLVNGTVTVDANVTWNTAVADVIHLKAINCEIEWNPNFAGNPAGLKQFYETNLLFKTGFQKTSTISFWSDVDGSYDNITLTAQQGNGAWGQFDWGQEVWGGEGGKSPYRLGVPHNKARCNMLAVKFTGKVVYSDFQLNGVSLTFNPTGTRTVR